MWADAQCFFQRIRQEGKDKGTSRVFSSNRCPQLAPGGPSESRVHKEASGKQKEKQGHKVVPTTQRNSEGSTIPPSSTMHAAELVSFGSCVFVDVRNDGSVSSAHTSSGN